MDYGLVRQDLTLKFPGMQIRSDGSQISMSREPGAMEKYFPQNDCPCGAEFGYHEGILRRRTIDHCQ